MSRRHLGQASLGAITYCTSCHLNDECGADGLPLTPNSIRALGGFQKLKCLDHPTLCAYVDFIRCKHERIMVVSEHYSDNLSMAIKAGQLMTGEDLVQLAYEVLLGLDYLNQEGISHRSLSPKTVLFTEQGRVKLSNYGMYHMTDRGRAVLFPNGEPVYLAPEVLADGPATTRQSGQGSQQSQRTSSQSGYKVDVWSLGIILLEAYLGIRLWKTLTIQQIFHKLLSFLTTDIHPISIIEKDHGVEEKMKNLPEDLKSLVWLCLTVSPTTRPSPTQLLKHSVFDKVKKIKVPADCSFALATSALRCQNLELPVFTQNQKEIDEDRLGERSVEEIYYLWQLAGGDLEGLLWKAGLIRNHAPITKMASFVMGDGDMLGEEKDRSVLLDRTVVVLSQDQLRQRLEKVDPEAYYVLLENDTNGTNVNSSVSSRSAGEFNVTKQPLVIKEKDIEYQFHRIILYERLLKAYPYKRTHILREARVDIPPLYRAHVWAVLLDVEGHVQARYDAIDKMTPISTDRQIEVDIPRCHQYNELLSSHEGHAKLKRLLKAWVVSHPQYVYWQGLDSLSAPFLYLNFNNEALAYACLAKFIPKYLHKFFLKDNSRVIQEYLAVFSHLIAFHDPELSNHLDGIGFIPDLYAIPWFLTMYAHVFPLHKIFHLWDTLLLGNSSFPLYIGVAILYQLRDQLLSFGFNDCILLFSDMPEIDIQRCVTDSIRIFCSTPKSVTYRQHAIAPKKLEEQTSSQTFSYYTQDYNELPKTELSIDHISLEDLKAEKCARISAEDMIELGELQGQSNKRSPTKKTAQSKPNLLVIDVRSQEEFQRGSVTDSINIPFATAFGPEGDLLPCPAVQTLNKHKNQIKVVVGSHGKIAIHFAESLVQQNYSKVCVLHNGIDALRNSAILTVPPADL